MPRIGDDHLRSLTARDVLHREMGTMGEWARRRGAPPPDPDEAFAPMLGPAYG